MKWVNFKTTVTLVLFFQFFYIFFIPTLEPVYAEVPEEGYDVVFVLDTSYSMRDTDQEGIAAEVINMFMDMSDADRTRVGFVAYNHHIVASKPLTPIAVASQKSLIQREVKNLSRTGYTDLGLGLRKGSELLSSGTQKGRKPFLILLSDGETDFGASSGPRTKADSNKDVTAAIQSAKTKGYPVYTVGLNHDGTVNRQELERIASETGGASFITSSAQDLPEILNRIFASQIRSKLVPVAGITATGAMQEISVEIPDSSMEEANLIILSDHSLKETELYANSENIRRYLSNRYTILKIEHPQPGKLKLKLKGQRGDLIKINLLGSYRLGTEAAMNGNDAKQVQGGAPAKWLKGKKTAFEAYLVQADGQKLTDEAVYKSLKAEIVITRLKGDKPERVAMTYQSGALHANYAFPHTGDYTWQLSLDGAQFYRNGAVHTLHAYNEAPKPAANLAIDMVKEDGDIQRKLGDFFEDANDDSLTYTLDSKLTHSSLDVHIQGDTLSLSKLHTGTSELHITATDPEGASVSAVLDVTVHSRYTAIKWATAGIVVAGIVLYWLFRPKPQFTGRIEGYFLATASGHEIPVKSWPLTSFSGRKVTLQELFRTLDVHEPLPESDRILFTPGKHGALIVSHDTRCAVQHGKTPLARNKKAMMNYNDKLYITFEDGTTEIELRYKSIKPNTGVYTDHIKVHTG